MLAVMAGFQVGKRVAAAALLGMVALGLSNQAVQARETIAEQAVKCIKRKKKA